MVKRWLPACGALLVVALMATLKPLGPISRAIAIACVVASFLAAAALGRRDVRAHASVVAGVAAVAAAGQVNGGWLYGIAVVVFLATCLASLRAARAAEGASVPIAPVPIAKILVVTGVVATVAVLVLPPLAVRVERFVTGYVGIDGDETTAFSTTMRLGATRGMLQSDAIVLRMDGANGVSYLRGAVYDTYGGSHWITSEEGRPRTTIPSRPGASLRMTLDRHAPKGPDMRWFVPPNACNFDLDLEIDAFGIARRSGGPTPQRLAFATSGCTAAPIHPPTPRDLEVPDDVRRALAPIAALAADPHPQKGDKLRALSRDAFRGWEYSLEVPRAQHIDPVVDFMTVHRAGHCEMFASAMVMMARTQGIPARVVGGYHVSEVNPVTGQTIVRDRNAHAWVEAWYDGQWHAYDPTPASDGPRRRASLLDHLGDLWGLALDRLAEIGPLGYAGVLGVLIAVLLALRSLTRWVRRPKRARATTAMERPLPCFDTLMGALANSGFTRDESEPIETFATRVPSPASSALGAYAALRYGGVGDERTVTELVEAAARAATSFPRPSSS